MTQVEPGTCRAKVVFPDRQNVESPWLEVLQRNTLTNKDQSLPDEGELVAVLMGERDESGCVLGAYYTGNNAPENASVDVRRVTFPGNVVLQYDRGSNTLLVSGVAKLRVVGTDVELDATTKVGAGAEPVALATKVGNALTMLKSAIGGAATVGGDGGAALKAAIVAALAAWPPSVAASKLSSD